MGAVELSLICLSLFSVALLFACVGQAGASGFIAVMALFSFAPEAIKPTALILNILVSSVVAIRFYRSEYFSWTLLRPILILSIPAAFIGGYLSLPPALFNSILGVLLIIAALPLLLGIKAPSSTPKPMPTLAAASSGAGVGLLSGLTGMGGGVLLTPILIYCQWATIHQATALSAVFIFANSVMAFIGHIGAGHPLPSGLVWMAVAAAAGGAAGAQLGSRHLSARTVKWLLGGTLLAAGCRLAWGS